MKKSFAELFLQVEYQLLINLNILDMSKLFAVIK